MKNAHNILLAGVGFISNAVLSKIEKFLFLKCLLTKMKNDLLM